MARMKQGGAFFARHRPNQLAAEDETAVLRAVNKDDAAKRYDDFNPDLDDALDRREARRHRLSAAVFREADADGNGAVNKAEWLALVERRFEAADPDRDGSLSRAELRSDKGKAVARFMR